jgi:23S rRNA (adenine-N6)-dimethyltransferase
VTGDGRGRRGARRAYGQNFLARRALAAQLVADAGVGPDDLVVEIGAGGGMLTAELARRAGRVIAVEVDPRWAAALRSRLAGRPNVEVVEADAMRVPLPWEPFRVVGNIPFGATTRLLHRLLDDPATPLTRADLLVQWEVARKRAGRPRTAVSAGWAAWWTFRRGRRVLRHEFRPQPAVDACMLTVERRAAPLVPAAAHEAYVAFVRAVYDGTLGPELDARRWAALFGAYADPAGGSQTAWRSTPSDMSQ